MIYRIDIADGAERLGRRRHPADRLDRDRHRRSPSRVLLVIRNHRVLFRYTLRRDVHRRSCCSAAAHPRPPQPAITARRLDRRSAPFSFQPGELAKIALAIFFAGYLVQRPRLALAGRHAVPRHDASRARATSARSCRLGALAGGHRVPARPRHRLLFFGLFLVMLYVATGKTELGGDRPRPVLGGAHRREPDARATSASRFDELARLRSTQTIYDQQRRQLPARAGPLRPRAAAG